MAESSAVDTGYSWVILFAAFGINLLYSTSGANGVLFVEFRQYFGLSAFKASGINTVQMAIYTVGCLPAGVLVQRYGSRRIAILAAIFGVISYFSGAFVPEFAYLYFTFGVLIGIGDSLFWVNGQVIVQRYFNRRRALASSIFMTAFSMASAFYPPLSQLMINTYGWRGTLILLSGCWVQLLPLAALLRPHKSVTKSLLVTKTFDNDHDMREKATEAEMEENGMVHDALTDQTSFQNQNKLRNMSKNKCFSIFYEVFDTSLICRCEFLIYGSFRMSSTLVRVVPEYFLPAYAISSGIGKIEAAFLVTILAIAQATTRPIAGFLNDYLQSDRVTVCSVSGVVAGIVLISCFFMWHHVHFLVYSVLIGISTGIFSAVEIPAGVDLIGQEKLPRGFGISSFLQGIMLITFLPASAALADAMNSYKHIYLLCGILHFGISGLFLLVVLLMRRRESQKDESIDLNLQSHIETPT